MDLARYIEGLSGTMMDELYQSQYVCQAILRCLPPLAKQYLFRLLHCPGVPAEYLQSWCTAEGSSKHKTAMSRLEQLRLLKTITIQQSRQGVAAYAMHEGFQHQLQLAQSGASSFVVQVPPDHVLAAAPGPDDLDRHATSSWEALLLYVVTPTGVPPSEAAARELDQRPLAVDKLLQGAGLSSDERTVTQTGFQFLLLDTYNQLWILLREYIDSAARRSGSELSALMTFMLQLGFRRPGQPFPLQDLSSFEAGIAAHLAQLGLLLPFRVDNQVWLCPTRLALALSGGQSAEVQREVAAGFVVVETNFRVYAYTTSDLQTAVLKMFTRAECRLPNLYVGLLTRESVTGALNLGITANQVVQYLRQHAHPQVQGRSPMVPENVTEQVSLWEAESDRVQHQRAYLYGNFASPEMFALTLKFATNSGYMLWSNPEKQMVACKHEAHPSMREYIKSIK